MNNCYLSICVSYVFDFFFRHEFTIITLIYPHKRALSEDQVEKVVMSEGGWKRRYLESRLKKALSLKSVEKGVITQGGSKSIWRVSFLQVY